jgi:hypothetical protein
MISEGFNDRKGWLEVWLRNKDPQNTPNWNDINISNYTKKTLIPFSEVTSRLDVFDHYNSYGDGKIINPDLGRHLKAWDIICECDKNRRTAVSWILTPLVKEVMERFLHDFPVCEAPHERRGDCGYALIALPHLNHSFYGKYT